MRKRVYIIVLNYNNWQDTLVCAESILKNESIDYRLVIVDNASKDNSAAYLEAWAKGELEAWIPPAHPLRELSLPPVSKPLDYTRCDETTSIKAPPQSKVVIIDADQNRGYSAGNNIGIRYARARDDFDYIWVLNNDTAVPNETLPKLLTCAQNKPERYGIFGTPLLYYDKPDTIQAFGATFYPIVAIQKHLLAHTPYNLQELQAFNQQKIDYVVGASMLFTRKCIEDMQEMPEAYFIYFEEIDIATGCRRKGYDFYLCADAIVYHKESASIGKIDRTISAFSDFYALRNRLVFTRKYYPWFLPTVYAGLLGSLLLRLIRKDKAGVHNLLRILKTPLRKIGTLTFKA